jgi:hypothetical protein
MLFVPCFIARDGWRVVPWACNSRALPWTREDQQAVPHGRVPCFGSRLTVAVEYGTKDNRRTMPALRSIDMFGGSADPSTGIRVARAAVEPMTHEDLAWLWTMVKYADRYHRAHGELPKLWHQYLEQGSTMPWPRPEDMDESFDRAMGKWGEVYGRIDAVQALAELVGASQGPPTKPAENRVTGGRE